MSDYVRDVLAATGVPAERIVVRPNFVDDPGEPAPWRDDNVFVFAGRLSPDKGIEMLVDAWKRSGAWERAELRVAGSGPGEALVGAQDPRYRITALGLLEHAEVLELIGAAGVVVVPSLWPEPFGRGVIEAAACGRPSLVARSGGLPELVDDGITGWVAEPAADAFAVGLRRAADPVEQRRAGHLARSRFSERYTREISMAVLDRELRELAEAGVD